MDDTELHYVNYDAEETWDAMLRAYIEAGGDILYPGDEKEMLLRGALAIATAIMAKVDSALRMACLRYATGEYLKVYGEKRDCYYREAQAARALIRITFQPSGVSRVIPAGAQLTADGSLLYALAEDVTQTGTAQEVTTEAVCVQPGVVGNGLLAGTQLQFLEYHSAQITVTVLSDAAGGVDAEDEEVYRERIRAWGLSAVTTGPASRYEAEAAAVSTDILDVKALNEGAGAVGVYLILADGADGDAICAGVAQALSAEDQRPLTDTVAVAEAEKVEYTLNVKVWYSAHAGLEEKVEAVVAEYQAWQDRKIGRAWNPDRLMAMLYQAGCDRVQFLEGSCIDEGEAAEYTEIDPDQRCMGTITVSAVVGA